MFTDLNVFQMASAMARYAGQRQAVIAQNIANADTPGYRARDIAAFTQIYRTGDGVPAMRISRPGHQAAPDAYTSAAPRIAAQVPTDPNGNSVSIEQEMAKAVDVKRQYDEALAIYRSSLNILRSSLGRA